MTELWKSGGHRSQLAPGIIDINGGFRGWYNLSDQGNFSCLRIIGGGAGRGGKVRQQTGHRQLEVLLIRVLAQQPCETSEPSVEGV